ncbi:MAG: ABC transporter ATP-binding protein [Dehalococcoidia bacterium]|nr:ABC transporter ATP-binding protein [Dehalococcoidia bacterium]
MSSSQVIIDIENLTRVYDVGAEQVTAVKDVTLQIPPGQFIALVGRSGSGKTTLLNLMAGLDKPTSGSILFEGEDLAAMGEKELTNIRRHKVGFVFQAFGLLPLLSAFENVELPLRISGFGVRQREERTREALGIVGLLPRANHRPYELSGGEQQRVAIARAIVTRPPLILADEPTGELDSTNAQSIFGLFREMVETHGITVVAATHDSTLLAMADQVNEMRDGSIVGHLEGEDLQSRLEDIQASRYRDRPSDGDGASEVSEGSSDASAEQPGESSDDSAEGQTQGEDYINRFRRPADE